ncbi:hypothetical protein VOLCADRAFT_119951 [Volvox carteri f. nagariensis]|uniref:HD/PDEase domain-containing protein n=1 Tax=Volvox carteri f. nagariensis TaxID=3068 RepID=D8UIC4_VOLCA|nr:uncharacterized protein VOLCADRAFT_119951 [Volvox carteri f. nagariensis]EFJ40543.1 hypothetical protein VOLCADRAFT_119951 [Volvox carteri f. nagariensis]|eukprot:XP_002958393.1 hypothetical protein VOLCADRAFT_119951 [Volvox carteri f. nagariensis]
MDEFDGDREGPTVFTDTVDGTFSLHPYCIKVIDTPPFQRLRVLSQLGVTKFVFSGAVHSRFEHSLGTAHKSYKVARAIFKQQGGERAAAAEGLGVDMEEVDVKYVTLAGLTHDLGHGPLSHPFENFLERLGLVGWRHEDMSDRILDYLVTNYDVDIDRSEVARITDLIHGLPAEHRPGAGGGLWRPGRRFLFDIVANKRNGVDVDKVDYLQRDAAMCGVKVGCDFDRLLKKSFIKVLDDEVCYPWSEYPNILDLFRAREAMHRKVYTNRTSSAWTTPFSRGHLSDVEEKALTRAQEIVRLIRTRQLYRFGNQFTVPPEYLADSRWESMKRQFTPAEVASCYNGSEVPGGLQPDDVVCDENKIDHTMGGANPAERVGFFRSPSSRSKYYIGQHQVVGIMPHFFQERVLRVFTRHQDERYTRAIEEALRNWCDRRFGSSVQLATPVRPRRPQSEGSGAAAAAQPPLAPSGLMGCLPQLPREALVNRMADAIRPRGPASRIQEGGPPAAAAGSITQAYGPCGNGAVRNGGSRSHRSGSAASASETTGNTETSTPVRAALRPAPGYSWEAADGAGNAVTGAAGTDGLGPASCGPGPGVRGEEAGRLLRDAAAGKQPARAN